MDDPNRKQLTLYANPAAKPNPNPAAYGILLLFATHRRTTNNRMEITAAIKALQALKHP